jgi:hypothetical protein
MRSSHALHAVVPRTGRDGSGAPSLAILPVIGRRGYCKTDYSESADYQNIIRHTILSLFGLLVIALLRIRLCGTGSTM